MHPSPDNPAPLQNLQSCPVSEGMDITSCVNPSEQLYFSQFSSTNPFCHLSEPNTIPVNNCSANPASSTDTRHQSPPQKRKRDESKKDKSRDQPRDEKSRSSASSMDLAYKTALPGGDGDDDDFSSRSRSNSRSPSRVSQQSQQQQQSGQTNADVKSNITPKQQKQPMKQFYSEENSGPYFVFIEPIDSTQVRGKLNPTSVGRIIGRKIQDDRYGCQSSVRQKITVTARDPNTANLILRDPSLS
ncbi:hypothetical protein QAD02_001905 [Eretmocerus hayati]|uniref:Uncharacterized protein n=1 Tax=Eretmocerus hayati TaxID=131215 RepID=A0ACC2NJ47_9HYME|nr:hypothetical protein QAD02_001905 [Eretmocerus hayati]